MWSQYESLQAGWEDLRRALARPLHDRDPYGYWGDWAK